MRRPVAEPVPHKHRQVDRGPALAARAPTVEAVSLHFWRNTAAPHLVAIPYERQMAPFVGRIATHVT
jgi:hypothetical protein